MSSSIAKYSAVKFNFTLDPDVADAIREISKGNRSRWVNAVLRSFLGKHKKNKMTEGFQQQVENFDDWENLGFDAWESKS